MRTKMEECQLCEELKSRGDFICCKCYNELLGTKERDGIKRVIKIIDFQLENSVLLSIEKRILNKLKERLKRSDNTYTN